MAEYYKWTRDVEAHTYDFATEIQEHPANPNTTLTVRISFELKQRKCVKLQIKKTGWPSRWTRNESIPTTAAEQQCIYAYMKGKKGQIITKIFAMRQ